MIKVLLVACAGLVLLHTGGCAVRVKGKERPLVNAERIRGELRLSMRQDTEKRTSLGRKLDSESSVMQEELYLNTQGDVFDPMLMTYGLGLGLGLNQQKFKSDTISGNYSGRMNSYLLNTSFLPTKPYPFSVHMAKDESVMSRGFQSPLRMENTSAGVYGKLRVPGWPMTYSWNTNELEQSSDVGAIQDAFRRTSERFSYTVRHDFNERSRFSFRTDLQEVLQEGGSFSRDEKAKSYRLEHNYSFGKNNQHRLDSYVSYVERVSLFDSEVFDWQENLRLRHSASLSTFYNANFSRNTFANAESETMGGVAGLNHRLYDNFNTSASVFMSKSEFGSGSESTWQGGNLRFDYYRNNPWGRLSSYYDARLTSRESDGATGTDIVIDESHTFTDPLPVELEKRDIVVNTIVVTNSAGTEVYTEGVDGDYTVRQIGDRVELIIDTTDVDLPNISSPQELLIDYLYEVEGSSQEDSLTQSFRIEQEFNNGVSLYYLHRDRQSHIESDISRVSRDREYVTDTVGVDYHYKNILLGAEHSNTESTENSSETNRVWVSGNWPLTARTRFHGRVSQAWIESSGNQSRETSLFKAEGKIGTRLTRHLRLSGHAELRKEDSGDFGYTDGFRTGTALEYHRSALRVKAGLDYYYLDRRDTERATTMFYIRVIRRF
ncbi:MAG: hypothetical protein V3W44_07875 [Dehalococcoidales bacterium]